MIHSPGSKQNLPLYGQIERELIVRVFFAGSIVMFLNDMEPTFCSTSDASTPRNVQSTKRMLSMTEPGKLTTHITRGLPLLSTFSNRTLRTTGLLGPAAP